ncbi:hypothetical protein LX36DRAFT_652202 [Colletotrichum falcatum]|nr:hypothetical protein LX36DRAFT_652202 [Colletotrichum falcatum]
MLQTAAREKPSLPVLTVILAVVLSACACYRLDQNALLLLLAQPQLQRAQHVTRSTSLFLAHVPLRWSARRVLRSSQFSSLADHNSVSQSLRRLHRNWPGLAQPDRQHLSELGGLSSP